MISKKFRLKEREVKKVLQKGKPFFSYGIVLNYTKNKLGHNRFAIVIWGKSVITNASRTYYRRRFYDLAEQYLEKPTSENWYDLVFVVKKQTKLSKYPEESIVDFKKDISFLYKKSTSEKVTPRNK